MYVSPPRYNFRNTKSGKLFREYEAVSLARVIKDKITDQDGKLNFLQAGG
jgi:hypothetical protein